MILCATCALGCFRRFELGNDFVNCGGSALDWTRNWAAAKRTESFSISGKIHFGDRDVFPLDVPPNIHLGPIEQRLHANMFAFRGSRYELAPEFGRLIFVIPFKLRVSGRKVFLLGTRWF